MARVALARVIRLAIAGAAGGCVSFVLVDPSLRQQEEMNRIGGTASGAQALQNVIVMGTIVGLTIGAALILADELQTRSVGRIVRYSVLGALIGGLCGAISAFVAQIVFAMLLVGTMVEGQRNPVVLFVARTLGWGVMGAGAGLCPGMVSRSPRRIAQGLLGGALGGALGGSLFDGLANVTGGGSVSRAIGFILMGAAIGAAVALVEEFAKEYWLTALNGVREGRSFILSKEATVLGRNELADIPLFGDLAVLRQHARLLKANGAVTLMAEPGAIVAVNDRPTASQPLVAGDIFAIGAHRFRFGARRSTGAPAPMAAESPAWLSAQTRPGHAASDVAATSPPATPISGGLTRIDVVAGPHSGMVFALTPGAIIGRDPRCDIALTGDNVASRQHARLLAEPSGMGWRIEDGGSSNGLWINGQRVTNHLLQPGDQIGIGQSLLIVN